MFYIIGAYQGVIEFRCDNCGCYNPPSKIPSKILFYVSIEKQSSNFFIFKLLSASRVYVSALFVLHKEIVVFIRFYMRK